MSKQDAVATTGPSEVTSQPSAMLEVIARAATDPTVDVAKMRDLLEMQKELMAEERRVAFAGAMAKLQAELPQIDKTGKIEVKGVVQSRYAKLEDIHAAIKPLLAEHGFSFSFNEEEAGQGGRRFSARLTHARGHYETKYITLPLDTSGNKNSVQSAGSTTAYAFRYLTKMHLNIVERDEDTDGADLEPITEDQAKDLRALATSVGAKIPGFMKYMGVERFEDILQRDLKKAVNALEEKGRNK